MSLPYYQRYTRDLIDGTVGMGFENKLVYLFLIDLIMHHDGKLPDNPRYIAGMLECSVRKWNKIRGELEQIGKIEIISGFIRNYRTDKETERLRTFQDKQSENAKKRNKINGNSSAMAKPKSSHTDSEPDTESKIVDVVDARELSEMLKKTAGDAVELGSAGIEVVAIPLRWLRSENPYDLHLDVLPVIKSICEKPRSKKIGSWAYFEKPIRQARDQRLSGNPKPELTKGRHNEKPAYQSPRQRSASIARTAMSEVLAERAAERAKGE